MNLLSLKNAFVVAALAVGMCLAPLGGHVQAQGMVKCPQIQVCPPFTSNTVVLATTGHLGLGSAVSQTVRPGRYYQMHQLYLHAGHTYTIELNSAQLDSYLYLLDASQVNVLAADDDSGGYPNARIRFTATYSGIYTVMATTYQPGESGNYFLRVTRLTSVP